MVKPNSENLSFWRKKCTPKSKNHILHIEAERVKADLAQALDESYVDIEHTLAEVEVR